MNDNSFQVKMYFIYCHFGNVKGNWTHIGQKFHDQDLGLIQF